MFNIIKVSNQIHLKALIACRSDRKTLHGKRLISLKLCIFAEMKFAIIAAGDGSRLAQEGITEPKPLVRVRRTAHRQTDKDFHGEQRHGD